MNAIRAVAQMIKAAVGRLMTNAKNPPSPGRVKLDGRRGYGDNDIRPPGT
jgi:hypothetical protein